MCADEAPIPVKRSPVHGIAPDNLEQWQSAREFDPAAARSQLMARPRRAIPHPDPKAVRRSWRPYFRRWRLMKWYPVTIITQTLNDYRNEEGRYGTGI